MTCSRYKSPEGGRGTLSSRPELLIGDLDGVVKLDGPSPIIFDGTVTTDLPGR